MTVMSSRCEAKSRDRWLRDGGAEDGFRETMGGIGVVMGCSEVTAESRASV